MVVGWLIVASLVAVSEGRRDAVVASAQCAASCVQRYGDFESGFLANRSQATSCASSACRACLLPCQTRPVGLERCKSLCAAWLDSGAHPKTICFSSCRRFYSALDQKSLPAELPSSFFRLAVVCAEGSLDEMNVLLRWSWKSKTSASPVAFVIGVAEEERSWVSSSFSLGSRAVVSGLRLSNYRFRIRAVNREGQSTLSTEAIIRLKSLESITVRDFEVTFEERAAVVRWKVNRGVCRYQTTLIRMTDGAGRRMLRGTVEETAARFDDLLFGADYLLRLYPMWPNADSYVFRFRVPDCRGDCVLATSVPITSPPDRAARLLFGRKQRVLRIKKSRQSLPRNDDSLRRPIIDRSLLLGVILPVGLVGAVLMIVAAYRLVHSKFSVREAFLVKLRRHSLNDQGRPDPFETSFTRLEFVEEIGRGEFGVVHRGQWSPSERVAKIDVAVKRLQPQRSGNVEVKQFLAEIVLMKRIGRHRNVVSLLGCCTRPTHPLCLIMDLCHLGSVRDNLLKMSPNVDDADQVHCLLRIALDVATGMEYLSQLNFVHRDLACRNVLLTNEWVAKIADFGLSRDVYRISVYRCGGEQRLPFRWMSPEALSRRVFSTASDVWSFGVLLWEIMTLGALPFPTLKPEEILAAVEKGERLSRPKLADDATYEVMTSCWEYECEDRPQFREIRQIIEETMNMRHEYVPLGSPQGTASISCGYLQL